MTEESIYIRTCVYVHGSSKAADVCIYGKNALLQLNSDTNRATRRGINDMWN